MTLVRPVIVAFWLACFGLLGLIAGTLVLVPEVMEERLPADVVPWLFTAIAAAGSVVAAFLARLVPAVARTYSLWRLILAGGGAWPVAWWLGVKAKHALESAGSQGIFAISADIGHVAIWYGVVAVLALPVLLAHRGSGGPPAVVAAQSES